MVICTVLCSVFLILLTSFGILCSDAVGNVLLRKKDITLNASFLATL